MNYRENIEDFLDVMTGKKFVKNAIFDENKRTLFINFFNSYEEYKEHEEKHLVDENQYNSYIGTFNKIQKLVVLESARILRDFNEIENVSMSLHFEGKSYDANVNRDELNRLIGYDIRELSPLNDSWRDKFSDIYGYGKENDKRSELFNQFVITTNE
ncbi:hypothetical protein [Niallia taxi]|uniref:hypothetical protein n=1 Tax=Niallia taxi TaxID=2499688 RepID=UPI0015F6F982|nr:hypothetical protein [Niallia taxi]